MKKKIVLLFALLIALPAFAQQSNTPKDSLTRIPPPSNKEIMIIALDDTDHPKTTTLRGWLIQFRELKRSSEGAETKWVDYEATATKGPYILHYSVHYETKVKDKESPVTDAILVSIPMSEVLDLAIHAYNSEQ